MISNKQLYNQKPASGKYHELSKAELVRLQKTLLVAYKEIEACCEKNELSIAMCGGNAIGAIRHKGFIPWDDDVDLIMLRSDFERFKQIFNKELGDKYILNSPNLSEKPTNRFAKIIIKGTRFVEMDMDDDERACIKLDVFILENIPENKIVRVIKGSYCNLLMAIASAVDYYEHKRELEQSFLNETERGRNRIRQMILIGRLFSFRSSFRWFDSVDKHCQYKRESSIIGNPAGTNHYFGVMLDKKVFFPFRKVPYENTEVYIPNDYDAYLKTLFGNYMEIPSEENREHHFISKIKFIDD